MGLLLPRSAQAITAILAVLKTGAAYVPVDPGHPDERVGFVFGDAGPVAVVTTAGLRDRVAEFDVPIIDIEDGYRRATSDSVSQSVADDVAYLICVGDTTGKPKGCAGAHRSVVSCLVRCRRVGFRVGGRCGRECHSWRLTFRCGEMRGPLLCRGRSCLRRGGSCS